MHSVLIDILSTARLEHPIRQWILQGKILEKKDSKVAVMSRNGYAVNVRSYWNLQKPINVFRTRGEL